MIEAREKSTKQSFFDFWLLEMREKRAVKDLVFNHLCSLGTKAFHALKQNARVHRQRKYLLEQG